MHGDPHCACYSRGRCWPMTEAEHEKRTRRGDARCFADDLQAMKWRRAKPFKAMSAANILKSVYGPRFAGPYAKTCIVRSRHAYEVRRSCIFNIGPCRTREEIARDMGLEASDRIGALAYQNSPSFGLVRP